MEMPLDFTGTNVWSAFLCGFWVDACQFFLVFFLGGGGLHGSVTELFFMVLLCFLYF